MVRIADGYEGDQFTGRLIRPGEIYETVDFEVKPEEIETLEAAEVKSNKGSNTTEFSLEKSK